MPSSGQFSKYCPMGHFLSTHQNTVIILEKVARATNQGLLDNITEFSDKAMRAFLILGKS